MIRMRRLRHVNLFHRAGESLKEGAETYSIRGLQCSLNNSLSRNPSHHGGYAAAPSHSALGLNLEMISSRTILQQQLPYHNTNYQSGMARRCSICNSNGSGGGAHIATEEIPDAAFSGSSKVQSKASKGEKSPHEDVLRRYDELSITPNIYTYTIMMDNYCKAGDIPHAILMFEKMRKEMPGQMSFRQYNSAMHALIMTDQGVEALQVLQEARSLQGFAPDEVTFTCAMRACGTLHIAADEKAEKAVAYFKEMTDTYGIAPTVETYNALLQNFARTQQLDVSVGLFQDMLKQGLEPNMITYRAVLNCSSRVHEAQLEFAFSWLDIMRENKMTLSADIYELVMMICMKAEEYDKVLELYREMHDAGVEPKVYSYIMLLAIHGRRGDYQAAWDLFHSVRSRRSIPRSDNLYNAAICAMRNNGQFGHVLELWGGMQADLGVGQGRALRGGREAGWYPRRKQRVYGSVAVAAAHLGLWEVADEHMKRVKVTGRNLYVSLMDVYRQAGRWQQILDLVEHMDATNTVMCREIAQHVVYACRQTRTYHKAYQVYQRLIAAEVEDMDTFTFNLIFSAHGVTSNWPEMEEMLEGMRSMGVEPDAFTYNTLIASAARAGNQTRALDLLGEMMAGGMTPTVLTFNPLLDGLVSNKQPDQALGILQQALLRNVYGDPIQLSSSTAVLDVEGMSTGAAVISIVHWLLLLKDHHQAMVIEDASSTPDVKIIGLPESAESFGLRHVVRGLAQRMRLPLQETGMGMQLAPGDFFRFREWLCNLNEADIRAALNDDAHRHNTQPAVSAAIKLSQGTDAAALE
eukprot:CAMPEP_0114268912 /NCGR_PEP_ID=MMETSP0058-20121206/26277_1 /TAXON_ID=36894 /ORGANISM="Pyramimonas parkeae, CCMP726" /LENGTH=804 /DNA_ID=CAMNT_0001387253 /DNA_START=167 /DNA_END=2581 /DNA_ORIENTATION=+